MLYCESVCVCVWTSMSWDLELIVNDDLINCSHCDFNRLQELKKTAAWGIFPVRFTKITSAYRFGTIRGWVNNDFCKTPLKHMAQNLHWDHCNLISSSKNRIEKHNVFTCWMFSFGTNSPRDRSYPQTHTSVWVVCHFLQIWPTGAFITLTPLLSARDVTETFGLQCIVGFKQHKDLKDKTYW